MMGEPAVNMFTSSSAALFRSVVCCRRLTAECHIHPPAHARPTTTTIDDASDSCPDQELIDECSPGKAKCRFEKAEFVDRRCIAARRDAPTDPMLAWVL
ncbi:hypothetical protein Y032_0730g1895 [Ancylostoma ceylanicum]|uniref:Uncharacterized protein n=1 Tax=Ancylostoma ceylanicum TaxID=53326 RepID=A0A016WGV9_9BILA|nr:hypothetical protein Y032_0730g1895 [Ancylostoma ceylanicum]